MRRAHWAVAIITVAQVLAACSGSPDAADKTGASDDESADALRRRDAGAHKKKDAGATSDAATVLASDDPFDAASCVGPSLTSKTVLSRFAPFQDRIDGGHYVVKSRGRSCNENGCTAWSVNPYDVADGTYVLARATDSHGAFARVELSDRDALGLCTATVWSTPLAHTIDAGYSRGTKDCTGGSQDPRTCYGYCRNSTMPWTASGIVTDACLRLVAHTVTDPNPFGDTYEEEIVIYGTTSMPSPP